jgi:hypothetical protein
MGVDGIWKDQLYEIVDIYLKKWNKMENKYITTEFIPSVI